MATQRVVGLLVGLWMALAAPVAGQLVTVPGLCPEYRIRSPQGRIERVLVQCGIRASPLTISRYRPLWDEAELWWDVCQSGVEAEVAPAKRVQGVVVRGPQMEHRDCAEETRTLLTEMLDRRPSRNGTPWAFDDEAAFLRTVVTVAWFGLARPAGWEAQRDSALHIRPQGEPCGVYTAPCPPFTLFDSWPPGPDWTGREG